MKNAKRIATFLSKRIAPQTVLLELVAPISIRRNVINFALATSIIKNAKRIVIILSRRIAVLMDLLVAPTSIRRNVINFAMATRIIKNAKVIVTFLSRRIVLNNRSRLHNLFFPSDLICLYPMNF